MYFYRLRDIFLRYPAPECHSRARKPLIFLIPFHTIHTNPLNPNSMKRIILKTLKQSSLPILFTAMLLLWSCGGGGGAQRQVQEEQLEEVKESVTSDLYELRHDIMERIAYVDHQLEEATGETQEVLEASQQELKEQLADLEQEIKNVREASLETWDSVLQHVTATVTRVQEERNEISLKVRELLEGE